MEGWNTTWPGMSDIIHVETQKIWEVVNSSKKLIIIEKIFLGIGKLMLKTSYILNLGQSLKIALELKINLWKKLNQRKLIIQIE
jgi:hypothetical protein